MAHTKPITGDWWYDEEPGDEGPFPGGHRTSRTQTEALGMFDFVSDIFDDFLPIFDVVGDVISYLDPEEGVVDINAPEELEEFEVIAADQPDLVIETQPNEGSWLDPWLDIFTTSGWDFVTDVWDYLDFISPGEDSPYPRPELDPMPVSEVPTPGESAALGTMPRHCAPGAARFSVAKARSSLLKRAAYALGQCSLKYSSFKWLVVHTGLSNAMRTFQLTERQINFLLLNPIRRRGRGITASNIRTVNRTMSKLESLNRRLNCACGPKRTYKRKKTCR